MTVLIPRPLTGQGPNAKALATHVVTLSSALVNYTIRNEITHSKPNWINQLPTSYWMTSTMLQIIWVVLRQHCPNPRGGSLRIFRQ